MKCAECKINYPEEILSQMVTSNGTTGMICGICALEISNQLHGDNRTEFSGEIAESFRLAAIEHRDNK